jgi:hypothetical protein
MTWPPEVDEVIAGDITVAAAYVTPAGGAVVTGVAPCGLVGFTTSLGFGKKLERLIRDPKVALAYHTREHGFSARPEFVLVQGRASVDLKPSRARLEEFRPQAERFLGPIRRGPVWDRVLREYYDERVFVDVDVTRVTAWPNLTASGQPAVYGAAEARRPAGVQRVPKNGSGPRVDVSHAVGQLASLPHRLLAYRGRDGMPVVVPVEVAGHDASGFRLVVAPGRLPPGGRRAGLLAHSFRPQLVGLSTRTFTGWLEVAPDGREARYAPHTSKGFWAPPRKNLLLVSNGLFAKYGLRQARRHGVAETLAKLAADRSSTTGTPGPPDAPSGPPVAPSGPPVAPSGQPVAPSGQPVAPSGPAATPVAGPAAR